MNELLLQSTDTHIFYKGRANFYKTHFENVSKREKELKIVNRELRQENKEKDKTIRNLEKENDIIKAELINLKTLYFGRKSEKGKNTSTTGNTTSTEEKDRHSSTEEKKSKGQKPGVGNGHGRTSRSFLPEITIDHELGFQDRICPICGLPYYEINRTEDSSEIDWEVKIVKKRHRRKCYIRTCRCNKAPLIKTASVSPKLISKGLFSINFWINILLEKYLYQRSLNSLLKILEMRSCPVSPGTVIGGLSALCELIKPVHIQILERNRSAVHWFCDETRWKVFIEVQGKNGYCWWLWVFISVDTCVYIIDPSRSAKVPSGHLGDKTEGIISCDRFSAYKSFAGSLENLQLAYCWVHVRRDFVKIQKGFKSLNGWASVWIDMICELYSINNKRIAHWIDPDINENTVQTDEFYNEDKLLREKIIKFKEQVDDELSSLPVKKKNEKAVYAAKRGVLTSIINHWSGLIIFVDNPKIPMDNNTAERGIRNPVVGRKNYYGNGAEWSAKFSAMLFTLFQTLLRNNINPEKWLRHYFKCCAENRGKALDNVENFLPWNMTPEQKSSFNFSGGSP